MEAQLRDLEQRLQALEEDLHLLSEHLNYALAYIAKDPSSSLTKSRIVLEKLVYDMYHCEMGRSPEKRELGLVLRDRSFTDKIERRILSRMHSVRAGQ